MRLPQSPRYSCMLFFFWIEQALSAEKDERIAALSQQVATSMDSFEIEQDKTRELTREIDALRSEITAIQADKDQADGRVQELSSLIGTAEEQVMQRRGS